MDEKESPRRQNGGQGGKGLDAPTDTTLCYPGQEILDAALEYIDNGRSVIPVRRSDKKPYLASWGEYQKRLPTPEEIESWWKQWPEANVGMITGKVSNLWVADADGPRGIAWIDANCPPTGVRSVTGKGRHSFYRPPEGVTVRNAVRIAPEVDIRGEGGYVVCPPSIHENGRRYEWEFSLDGWEDLAVFAPNGDRTPMSVDDMKKIGARQSPTMEPVAKGERNATLARLAGKWISRGLDDAEVVALALQWNSQNKPPLDDKEIATTLESIRKTHSRNHPEKDLGRELIAEMGVDATTLARLASEGQKGCATLFYKIFQNRFCFDHAAGVWHCYREHFWAVAELAQPLRGVDSLQAVFLRGKLDLLSSVVRDSQKLADCANDNEAAVITDKIKRAQAAIDGLDAIIKKLHGLFFRKQVVEFSAVGEKSLGIAGSEWDLAPELLPCVNGVIELRTGTLRPGRPEEYLKAVCPTPFDPQAPAPLFTKTLAEIFADDQDLIAFFQRVVGMAIWGRAVDARLIVLYGIGRNGKDTIMEALGFVLGPHLAGAIQSESLMDQGRLGSSAGPSPDIMRLRGRRLAWGSETSEGRRFDAGKIKLLTGGGMLVGRAPYARAAVSFPQSHSLFLLTNNKPHAPADDYAFWKRLLLVPFTQSFVDDPQAPHEHKATKDLAGLLTAEAPGILNWAVAGCLEWQKSGLRPPTVVKEATQAYREEEDILLDFITDACEVGDKQIVGASALYNHYKNWMIDNGMKPMSGTKFGRKMSDRFDRIHMATGNHYIGVGQMKGLKG